MSNVRWTDRRIVLWMSAVMIVLIVAISVLAPASGDEDARPSSYNAGPRGAKGAFLTLQAIGTPASRWSRPITELNDVDASHTTLVLAAPAYSPTDRDAIAAALNTFMERGGHVLTTGPMGALLLPGGSIEPPTLFMTGTCETDPGEGRLAAAGRVSISDEGAWGAKTNAEIAERCGRDAVVIRMNVGRGEAVWWSSARPLTNDALKTDADLRLLLLSLGEGRTVLWDESLQNDVPGLWSAARGLPLRWLIVQVVLVAILLVLSYGRRNGPIRSPVAVPRTSPLEFAFSMGDLYEKARATTAATEAARRKLMRAAAVDAGVSQAALSEPQSLVEALNGRLGGDWSAVGTHLEKAIHDRNESLTNREALAIARALSEDADRIREAARRGRPAIGVRLA